MRTFPRARRARVSLALTMLLLLVGCVSAGLAYEAFRVERAHRTAAEDAMHDFASFAAWEFASRARDEMQTAILPVFRPLATGLPLPAGDTLPRPGVLQPAAEKTSACGCPVADSTGVYFRLELPRHELTTACGIGPVVTESGEMRLVSRHAGTAYRPEWDFAAVSVPDDSLPAMVTYTVVRGEGGKARAIYGFHTSLAGFGGPAFRRVLAGEPLLPRSLAPGDRADSLFAVLVTTASGDTLFRSPVQHESRFAAVEEMGPQFGNLRVRVALHPGAAGRLVFGGVPPSRLPVWLGALVFSVALAGVSLRQLRRERELGRMRESFVSEVSHELRTPLSQIRICAEMLRLGRIRSEAERLRSVDMIDRQAVHLSHLVDNVLHFSHEVPEVPVDPVPADIGQVVQAIVADYRPLAASRRAELVVQAEEGVVAPVDRDALQQVLVNLIGNALKHGPEEQTVTVGVARAGSAVRVWVDDEGPGVPPAERTRIFEPYVRLARRARGSGIGLAVVRGLVEQHGGTVRVEDAPGGGARFVVELWRTPYLPGSVFRPRLEDELRRAAAEQGVA